MLDLTLPALSVRQPWSWLICHSFKDVENRGWSTGFRGELLIHAGLRFDLEGYAWVRDVFPEIPLPDRNAFERGGIVGSATLTACVTESDSPWFFGDYGFVFADPRSCALWPCRGMLGFFDVTAEVEAALRAPTHAELVASIEGSAAGSHTGDARTAGNAPPCTVSGPREGPGGVRAENRAPAAYPPTRYVWEGPNRPSLGSPPSAPAEGASEERSADAGGDGEARARGVGYHATGGEVANAGIHDAVGGGGRRADRLHGPERPEYGPGSVAGARTRGLHTPEGLQEVLAVPREEDRAERDGHGGPSGMLHDPNITRSSGAPKDARLGDRRGP